ncbi:MAG: hypothetical protein E7277_04580 [Lachnospiraceae bacterium]|jgi:flagellar biosynthesis/type III secretory pathway chaperone|nr:hypothetical protein [Lachnospiraceae bacterium]
MDERHYLDALIKSLQQKREVLIKIIEKNVQQTTLLSQESVDVDVWERLVDEKGVLIEQLNFLDAGFEEVYERVHVILKERTDLFREEVACMQKLISEITDLSVTIQSGEMRNRDLAERQFSKYRNKAKSLTQNNRAAKMYRSSMRGTNALDPQFMDKKH